MAENCNSRVYIIRAICNECKRFSTECYRSWHFELNFCLRVRWKEKYWTGLNFTHIFTQQIRDTASLIDLHNSWSKNGFKISVCADLKKKSSPVLTEAGKKNPVCKLFTDFLCFKSLAI